MVALANSMSQTLREAAKPSSASEKEKDRMVRENTNQIRITFSQVVPDKDPLNPGTVVLGETTALCQRILTASTVRQAQRLFHDALGVAQRKLATSEHRLDASVTITPEQCSDSVLLSTIRNSSFLTQGLAHSISGPKTKLSILAFASAPTDSVEFQNRVLAGERVVSQELIGEATSKIDRKTTEIYLGGKIEQEAIVHACANFRFFWSPLVSNFDGSEIWRATREFLLLTQRYPDFLPRFGNNQFFAMHMFSLVHDIQRNFFTLGTMLEFRSAVDAGQSLHPQAFTDAAQQGIQTTQKANTAAHDLVPMHFAQQPAFAAAFPQWNRHGNHNSNSNASNSNRHSNGTSYSNSYSTDNHNSDNNSRGTGAYNSNTNTNTNHNHNHNQNQNHHNNNNNNRSNQRGGGGSDSAHRNARNPAGGGTTNSNRGDRDSRAGPATDASRGFIKWSGNGQPPRPNFTVKLSGMQNAERLCMNFVTVGKSCRWGRNCKQAHPGRVDALPDAQRTELRQFVTRTTGFAFTTAAQTQGTNA